MSVESNEFEKDLRLNEMCKAHLREAAKWSKFLAIVGFIGIGFMVLVGIFMGTLFNNSGMSEVPGMEAFNTMGTTFLMILYIIIGLIYYFPIKYLYDFSIQAKSALDLSDSFLLEDAFSKLKSHYKYIGIMMIIILSLYALMFVFFGMLASLLA